MNRVLFFIVVLALLLLPAQAGAQIGFWPSTAATGGGTALDGLDGVLVDDGHIGFVATATGDLCVYVLDADADETETAQSPCPTWVRPDKNPGTKTWRLVRFVAQTISTERVSGATGYVDIYDDPDDTNNRIRVTVPSTLGADRTQTLLDKTGVVASSATEGHTTGVESWWLCTTPNGTACDEWCELTIESGLIMSCTALP